MLEDFSSNGNSNSCRDLSMFVCLRITFGNQLVEPVTVHCCGLEFRVLNGYDQKSLMKNEGLKTALFNVILT
ncbi:hypothetical protein Tco_1220631 [Tanacetum coccineum]